MRTLLIIAGLLIAAAAATFVRYESFDPCDWMAQDLEAKTGLPGLIIQARIRAHFLLDGITEPDQIDCLLAWWEIRKDGLPPES